MSSHQGYESKIMEIRSLEGSETFYWDSDKQALVVLLANGDRIQWAFYDVILMLRLLSEGKVQRDIAKALEAAPKAIKEEIGTWRGIQAAQDKAS